MASKFTKFLLFTATTAAAAAGIYYLMQKKNAEARVRCGCDEDDDFEFDEDLDEPVRNRSYVSLNFDNAGVFASEACRRAKEKITEVKDTILAGIEGASVGMREFVDLTREEAEDLVDEVADEIVEETPKKAKAVKKALNEAEEAVNEAITEGVNKVEDFFDEDE